MVGQLMNKKLARICDRGRTQHNLTYYPSVRLEDLRISMKILSQVDQSTDGDLNLGSPKCET
jgi:hypothetical protein